MSAYKVITLNGTSKELAPYYGFIFSNWLFTLRWTNDWFFLIHKPTYYSIYRKVISNIISAPECKVNIAILDDDPDLALGWSVYANDVLHYVFVKRDLRKQGIGRSLMPKGINRITHLTVSGAVIWKTKIPKLKFDPFYQ